MSDIEEREWPKEPWTTYLEASALYFRDADGRMIGAEPWDLGHDCNTAERIVACVNACAGVPTKKLEALKLSIQNKLAELAIDVVEVSDRYFDNVMDDLIEAVEKYKSQLTEKEEHAKSIKYDFVNGIWTRIR